MFHTPFTLCLAGTTGSGKTQWLKRFIAHSGELMEPTPKHILYCYGVVNPTILEYKAQSSGIELFNGVPDEEMILNRPKPLLLCLDDLYLDINSKFLDHLFTRGSHNWNVNVVLVTQALYNKELKVARMNSHVIVLMRMPSGLKQVHSLGSQLFPGTRLKHFMEAYADATSEKWGYLVVNMQPDVDEDERLLTKIFPGERTAIYLPLSSD